MARHDASEPAARRRDRTLPSSFLVVLVVALTLALLLPLPLAAVGSRPGESLAAGGNPLLAGGAASPSGPVTAPTASTPFLLLNGTVPYLPSDAVPSSGLNLNQTITIYLGLQLQNQSTLDGLLAAITTPGSLLYRDYLSHPEFVQRFEPSATDWSTVASYYEGKGLQVTPSNDRLYLTLTGSMAALESAFQIQFEDFSTPLGTYYFATSPLAIPASFGSVVTSAIGLTNYPYAQPMVTYNPALVPSLPDNLSAAIALAEADGFGGVAQPQPPYTPSSLELAYNETGLLAAGYSGQYETVAVTDAYGDPTAASDLAMYDSLFSLPSPPTFTVVEPYGNPSPPAQAQGALSSVETEWEIEASLDFQMAHAFAPAANLVTAISPDGDYTLDQTLVYLITNQLANVISNSWGIPEPEAGSFINYMHPFFEMAAAEGITVVAASGDQGSLGYGSAGLYGSSFPMTVMWPSSDPFVTAVGGTTLAMQGEVNTGTTDLLSGPPAVNETIVPTARQFETTWDQHSGGGFSRYFARPTWQSGWGLPTSGPNSTQRGVPDVAMPAMFQAADFVTNGNTALSFLIGGTSLASPMWAGVMAVIDSYALDAGNVSIPQLGFVNPALYDILKSPAYNSSFFDITQGYSGPNPSYPYLAGPGWDPTTGLGSPNVGNLARQLAQYTFTVGVAGDRRAADNQGVRATVETVAPQTIWGTSADYFGVSDRLADGSWLFAGYTVSSQDPLGAWFFGSLPAGGTFDTQLWQVGPDGSAGSSGSFHTYAIQETAPGVWTYELDGASLGQFASDAVASDPSPTSSAPVFFASTVGSSNLDNQLGPVGATDVEVATSSGWTPLPAASAVETSSLFSGIYPGQSGPAYPFANPYGIEPSPGDQGGVIAGSTVNPVPNGAVLWGEPEAFVPTTLLATPDPVALYAQHVSSTSASVSGYPHFPLSTAFPTGQADVDDPTGVPLAFTPSIWSFGLSTPTVATLHLAPQSPVVVNFFASLWPESAGGDVPVTLVAVLNAGPLLVAEGTQTQNLQATGVTEFNLSMAPQTDQIPAYSEITLTLSWYVAYNGTVLGTPFAGGVAVHSGQQYPLAVVLPLLNPVDMSSFVVVPATPSSPLTVSEMIRSPFGAYDLLNGSIQGTVNGRSIPMNSTAPEDDTYTWTIPSLGNATRGTFRTSAADLQGFVNSNSIGIQIPRYPAAFTEVGLPAGVAWTVTMGAAGSETTNGTSLQFNLTNGTYSFEVRSSNRSWEPLDPSGSLVINGTGAQETILFAEVTFPIHFVESGLPNGTSWGVILAGEQETSTGASITFSEPNGSYPWKVLAPPDYLVSPSQGNATVQGDSLTIPVTFVSIPPNSYPVQFNESGLPAGTAWTVTLGGASRTSTGTTIVFYESNGTYSYTVTTANSSYAPSTAQGTVAIRGHPAYVSVPFVTVVYGVTFVETGLPTGSSWSVLLGSIFEGSTGTQISFSVANGTYSFQVYGPKGYAPTPSSGTVSVRGGVVQVSVTFSRSLPTPLSGSGDSPASGGSPRSAALAWEVLAGALPALAGATAVVGRRRSRRRPSHRRSP